MLYTLSCISGSDMSRLLEISMGTFLDSSCCSVASSSRWVIHKGLHNSFSFWMDRAAVACCDAIGQQVAEKLGMTNAVRSVTRKIRQVRRTSIGWRYDEWNEETKDLRRDAWETCNCYFNLRIGFQRRFPKEAIEISVRGREGARKAKEPRGKDWSCVKTHPGTNHLRKGIENLGAVECKLGKSKW